MIALHCGVGRHPAGVKEICSKAVRHADFDPVKAVITLEDDPILNCGHGSSLTDIGTVECEAGYMTSHLFNFGGAGVLSHVKNPCLLARHIAQWQCHSDRLVSPMVLVGSAADSLAKDVGLDCCSNEALISAQADGTRKASLTLLERFDTVGAFAIKPDGVVEASISSGGPIMKKPGRLGHSVTFGAGIWAEHSATLNMSVGVALSGCGELLCRTRMAEKIAQSLFARYEELHLETVKECVRQHFTTSPLVNILPSEWRRMGGIVGIMQESHSELVAFHNTAQLPYAFQSGGKVRCRVLNNGDDDSGQFVFEAHVL